MDSETIWKIIDSKFRDNYQTLVRHHIESYNHFYNEELIQIFKEKNPLILGSKFDKDLNDYREKCIMYFGGKDGNKIYMENRVFTTMMTIFISCILTKHAYVTCLTG